MNSIQRIARSAGILYLIIAVAGAFSFMYVRSSLLVAGDANETAANIAANAGLLRLGIAADAIVFLSEIVLTVLLFILLEPVSRTLALVAAFARLAMATMQGINLLTYALVLLLLGGASYLTVFTPEQLNALALLFLNAYEYVALFWGMFFALHLLTLGYLIYKSGYFPALLGLLMVLAGLGYLIDSFGSIFLPQYDAVFAILVSVGALVGELGFALWLLIKGVNVEKWQECSLATAQPVV